MRAFYTCRGYTMESSPNDACGSDWASLARLQAVFLDVLFR